MDPAQTFGSPVAMNASGTISLAVDRKHPPVTITSLPNEVHHLIASNLCVHCTGYLANPDQPSHTNSAELFNLCLVDTHWRDIATQYLYHFCVLRQKAVLLVYTLFERPDLAKHIKSFSFREVKPQAMEIPKFRRPRGLENFTAHASLGTHALKPMVEIGTMLWAMHCFQGTAMWHQWLMLQTPALETVSVYHQHQLHLPFRPDIERLTFMEIRRNVDIPTMLIFDSPSYVPRQAFPHRTGCYRPYGWPFDNGCSLRDLAIDCMFIRCGGMEEIQYISHGNMEEVACQNLTDSCVKRLKELAPTLKRLRLGGNSGKCWGDAAWDRSTEGSDVETDPRGYLREYELLEVLRVECRSELYNGNDLVLSLPSSLRCLSLGEGFRAVFLVYNIQGLIERIKRGELPQFRSLHIITKTNAIEMSPEELVIKQQLKDLGVELKFYEQDIRHGVDYAGLEDEGWTVHDKIGGSLDFQFSSKETSS